MLLKRTLPVRFFVKKLAQNFNEGTITHCPFIKTNNYSLRFCFCCIIKFKYY